MLLRRWGMLLCRSPAGEPGSVARRLALSPGVWATTCTGVEGSVNQQSNSGQMHSWIFGVRCGNRRRACMHEGGEAGGQPGRRACGSASRQGTGKHLGLYIFIKRLQMLQVTLQVS